MAHIKQGQEREEDLEDTTSYGQEGNGASQLANTLNNINLQLDRIEKNQKKFRESSPPRGGRD